MGDCTLTSLLLPVYQRVILTSIVLYLEHPDAWYVPLEVKLDQCSWGGGLSCHHSFINPALYVTSHIAAICTTSGRRRNVWWSRIGFLDVVGVVGDVRKFYNNQVYSLVSFTSRVGRDAGEWTRVFHSTDQDVQSPVVVNQGPGGVRHQFAFRRNPVNGWLWITPRLTPLKTDIRKSETY